MKPLICPSCGSKEVGLFYHLENVPVHSVQIIRKVEEAKSFPVGDIDLGCCRQCGFVSNYSYDAELQDYSNEYESTQSFSGTYNQFALGLVDNLVNQFGVFQKTVLEIGCGQGELLNLIAENGNNKCIGFDPAFANEICLHPSVRIFQDYYDEKYAGMYADAVICKMTLEHIFPVKEFIEKIRMLFHNENQLFFIQVPNAGKVFSDLAFWDVYYEHCSYFTKESLIDLLIRCGFEVISAELGYDDQYLMIVARVKQSNRIRTGLNHKAIEDIRAIQFGHLIESRLENWKELFYKAKHREGVLWGGGSKAVAFLTTLQINSEISCVVDVNPRKENTYLPGTGHKVVLPEYLEKLKPDFVIIMNPIYFKEIKQYLKDLGISAELLTVDL